jgi:BSD domain
MWSALKADLEELVSVVKEDTNIVLEKVQDESKVRKETAANKEAERRMKLTETFAVPLLNNKSDGDISEVEEEEARNVEEFLKSFDAQSKTNDITGLLEEYEDTLRITFEMLVPEQVKYEEFWERYYYRCDAKRIERQWAAEEERARKARVDLVGNMTKMIGSTLGSTAKAFSTGMANALTEDDSNPLSKTSIFGSSTGRPPFVLNTEVDDDDDEEELGWDDEDEEEEKEFDSGITSSNGSSVYNDQDEPTEEIEFKDEVLEQTKEQLKQAEDERDQLHETVELLKKELETLQCGNVASEILRKKLDEQEEELHAVKQELESELMKSTETDEHGVNLAAKVKHLTGLLSSKELQITKMNETMQSTKKALEEQVVTLTKENGSLRMQLEHASGDSSAQIDALQVEVATAGAKIASLTSELASTHEKLASTTQQRDAGKQELEATKAALQAKLDHAAKLEEEANSGGEKSDLTTPDSVSTGVKVEKPVVLKIANDSAADDEEDWGDDWD